MGTVCWEFHHEDNKHEDIKNIIKLKHNAFKGKISLYFDDKQIYKKRAFIGDEIKHSFVLEGQECTLFIAPKGLNYEYSLEVNGEFIPMIAEDEKEPIEWWTWIFVIACGIIPIIFIESLILMAIGIGGAIKCITIVRKKGIDRKKKLLLCIKATILAWVYLGIFYLIVNQITAYFLRIYT